MKTILLLIGILCSALPVLADELLIVQSVRNRASDELIRYVTRAVPARTETLILSDYAEVDLPRIVREEQPDVVLTVGEPAFKAARKVRGVPVVAVMSISLGGSRRVPANVTGIDLRIDPARYLKVFKALGLNRIGVEYDPARSGVYLAKAQHAAAQTGIELVLSPARSPREAVKNLKSLSGSASDGLWLVPDPTVATSINLEALFNFSLEQKKPVTSYSAEHLRKGAAVALTPVWSEMGQQAGEITNKLLAGTAPREIPVQPPQSFILEKNEKVFSIFGITTPLERLFPKGM